jgi:HAD superfamily hydrolase (TIGR01509 family)
MAMNGHSLLLCRNSQRVLLSSSTEESSRLADLGMTNTRYAVSLLRSIIFDLDGVLADSEPGWNQIDAKLLADYGVKYRGEYHQNVVGVSYRLAVEFYKKAFGLSVPTEEMMRRRGEIATEFFADRVGLFPHVKKVLEELRQMKLHLAVATSSVSASARPFLDRHQLTGFFEVIVTGEEVERGKPAPDIYLGAADKLGIPADACLVVEDALPGVAAAKAANMRVAAIPDTRFVDLRDYEKEVGYVLGSLKELPALVRKLAVAK